MQPLLRVHILKPKPSITFADAAGQRDAAEKRLKNLERLLIRADPASKPHQVIYSNVT